MYNDYLKKHQYPLFIKIFFLSIFALFIYVTSNFLVTDLALHRALKNKLAHAQDCFKRKQYYYAIRLYSDLIEKYGMFNEARKRIVQSCFACSGDNPEMYEKGLSYLAKNKYSNSGINELARYLPTKRQQKKFHLLFVEV